MQFKQKLAYMALGGLLVLILISILGQGGNSQQHKYQFTPIETSDNLMIGYLLDTETGQLQKVIDMDKDGLLTGIRIVSILTGKKIQDIESDKQSAYILLNSMMKRGGFGWLMPPFKQLEENRK